MYYIELKNVALTLAGVASVKAANFIFLTYEAVILTAIVSLIILLGICMLTKLDTIKVAIGVIALNATHILKVDTMSAFGFNAFVILILAVLFMKKKQESAAEKKLQCLHDLGKFGISLYKILKKDKTEKKLE